MINSRHLDWIRTLPCHCGDNTSTEAAHIRFSQASAKKLNPGLSRKDDQWVVPLCSSHHRKQHTGNEQAFWNEQRIDPIIYAKMLWYCTRKTDLVPDIVARARRSYSYLCGKGQDQAPIFNRSVIVAKVRHRNFVGKPPLTIGEETMDAKMIRAECDKIYAVLNDSNPDKATIKAAVDHIVEELEHSNKTPKKKK